MKEGEDDDENDRETKLQRIEYWTHVQLHWNCSEMNNL